MLKAPKCFITLNIKLLKIKYMESRKIKLLLFTFLIEKCSKTVGNSNT